MNVTFSFDSFLLIYIYAAFAYILVLFGLHLYSSSAFSLKSDNTHDSYSQVKDLMAQSDNDRIIDINSFLSDATENYTFTSPDYYHLPSDIFENVILDALNDLVDDFSTNPNPFLKSRHIQQIDSIAANYPSC